LFLSESFEFYFILENWGEWTFKGKLDACLLTCHYWSLLLTERTSWQEEKVVKDSPEYLPCSFYQGGKF
jgi:hypothetical protein